MNQNGISVVTTTWNERENIGKLVLAIRNSLKKIRHEIIIVDDNSPDGTLQIAEQFADLAVSKAREGQTKGLLHGMRLAKYPLVITIDSDLENDPAHIPDLVKETARFDVVVASRTKLPRISEKIASKTLGKLLGVTDVFSNYRAYRREFARELVPIGGETFGAEMLVAAKIKGLTIGEIKYDPPPRRKKPRIGGKIQAELRIFWALLVSMAIYLI